MESGIRKIQSALSSITTSLNNLSRSTSNILSELKESSDDASNLFSDIGKAAQDSMDGMKSFTDIISGVVDSTSTLGKIVSGLSGPYGQLAGAILGGTTALVDWIAQNSEAAQSAERLREAQEETNQVMTDAETANRDAQTAAINAKAENEASLESYQKLYDELLKLVDANGKVKEGYEDRVNFINGELNQAFGTNLQFIDGEVQGLDELKGQWDSLIEKQRAYYALNESSGLRDAAETNMQSFADRAASLQEQIASKEAEIEQWQNEIDNLQSIIDAHEIANAEAAANNRPKVHYPEDTAAQGEISRLQQQIQGAQSEIDGLRNDLNTVGQGYASEANKIDLYTQAQENYTLGNYGAVLDLTYQLETMPTYTAEAGATIDQLKDQAISEANELKNAAYLVSKAPDSQTAVDTFESALQRALNATQEYAQKTGQVIDGIVVGFDENGNAIIESVQEIRMRTNKEVDQGALELAGKINDAGIQVSDGFIIALSEKLPDIQEAAIQVLQALSVATEEQKPGLYEQLYLLGVEFDDNLKSGLKDNVQVVYQAGSDVITGFTDAAGNRITEVTPEFCQMLVDMGVVGKSQMDAYMQANNIQAPTMNPIATEEQAAAARQNVQSYLDSHPVTIKWGIGYENTTDEWYRQAASGGGSMYSYYHSRQYATGGLITQPHLGLVGEDGPEAIIPLSPSRRGRGLQLWQQAGKWLGVQLHAAGAIVSRMQPVSYPPILRNAEVQAQRMLLQSQLNTDAIRQACKEGCESAVLAVAVENRVQAVFNPKTAAKEMADYTDRELGRKVDLLKRYAK